MENILAYSSLAAVVSGVLLYFNMIILYKSMKKQNANVEVLDKKIKTRAIICAILFIIGTIFGAVTFLVNNCN